VLAHPCTIGNHHHTPQVCSIDFSGAGMAAGAGGWRGTAPRIVLVTTRCIARFGSNARPKDHLMTMRATTHTLADPASTALVSAAIGPMGPATTVAFDPGDTGSSVGRDTLLVSADRAPTSARTLPTGWGSWESLGGTMMTELDVVWWGQSRIDVFVGGTDNALWHRWWDGVAWRGWESLGGIITTAPHAVSWGQSRIDVLAGGTDNALWHRWWDGAAWRGWESVGGIITTEPHAVSRAPNRIDVFAGGTDNALWHLWYEP
jgi:hypothetical protein